MPDGRPISGSVNFVNVDEIARGLSPLRPSLAERDAAEAALQRAHRFIAAKTTFAMETTRSGRAPGCFVRRPGPG